MKNKIALFFTCFLLAGYLMAEDVYPNKWTKAQRHGAQYIPDRQQYVRWDIDQCGIVNIIGYNADGTQFSGTVKPNGNMSGINAQGHYWKFDHQKKMYFDFTTGQTIFKGKK